MEVKEIGNPVDTPVSFILSTRALFIESLVQLLCSKYESDPEKRGKLFSVICKYLCNMNLIESSYGRAEFDTLRSHYKSSVDNLVKTIQLAVDHTSDNLLKFMDSWYEIEYIEIKFIGCGAYGSVHKVQHKLDRAFYAVKKVSIRYDKSFATMKSLQEVYALAKLNHPNIIAYKRAWIEPSFEIDYKYDEDQNSSDSSSTTFPTHFSVSNDSSSFIRFEDSSKEISISKLKRADKTKCRDAVAKVENEDCVTESQLIQDNKHTESVIIQNSDERFNSTVFKLEQIQKNSSIDKPITDEKTTTTTDVTIFTSKSKDQRRVIKHKAILYIQMQLCDRTLTSWIDEKKKHSNFLDMQKVIAIFKKIVKGVRYLHGEKIIHHDIKPHNIFISNDENTVQLGDFGLSSILHSQNGDHDSSLSTSFEGCKMNSNVGTAFYAAPEQYPLTVRTYKSDVYSLGVLLLDMVNPYITRVERVMTLRNARKGIIPDAVKEFQMIADLIGMMINQNYEERPTAADVLITMRGFNVNEIVAISERLQCRNNEKEKSDIVTEIND